MFILGYFRKNNTCGDSLVTWIFLTFYRCKSITYMTVNKNLSFPFPCQKAIGQDKIVVVFLFLRQHLYALGRLII